MAILNLDGMERVLVFAAHPDDEIMICGGLLHRLSSTGKRVCVVSFTLGETAADTEEEAAEMKECRSEEMRQTDQILGIARRRLLHLSSQQVYRAVHCNNELHHHLIHAVRDFRPHLLISHDHDHHRDHNAIRTITPESVHQASEEILGRLGEPWETPVVLYGRPVGQVHEPDVIVEIRTDDVKAKISALRAQLSQSRTGFLQRVEQVVRARTSLWGARAFGARRYAEAFRLDARQPLRIPHESKEKTAEKDQE